MGPPRKISKILASFGFFLPTQKWAQMAPNGARRIFFLLIQTLPTFWAERILILRIFIFWIFLDPKFPDFQVPKFQISRFQNSGFPDFQISGFPDSQISTRTAGRGVAGRTDGRADGRALAGGVGISITWASIYEPARYKSRVTLIDVNSRYTRC